MPGEVQGLNQFKSLPVPATDGFGAVLAVNDIVPAKSIYINGLFDGYFVVYGTHDGIRFAPITVFRSSGVQVRETRDIVGAYQQLMVFRNAAGPSPSMSVSSKSVCGC